MQILMKLARRVHVEVSPPADRRIGGIDIFRADLIPGSGRRRLLRRAPGAFGNLEEPDMLPGVMAGPKGLAAAHLDLLAIAVADAAGGQPPSVGVETVAPEGEADEEDDATDEERRRDHERLEATDERLTGEARIWLAHQLEQRLAGEEPEAGVQGDPRRRQ